MPKPHNLIYAATLLASSLVTGHFYSNFFHIRYTNFSTQYETVGTFMIVSALSIILSIPILLFALALYRKSMRTPASAIIEALAAAFLHTALTVGIVIRIIPWAHWDHHPLLFFTLIAVSALASAITGALVARTIHHPRLSPPPTP